MPDDDAAKTRITGEPGPVGSSRAPTDLDATLPLGSTDTRLPLPPAISVPSHVGLGGKFEMHERIGRGGMGTVFRATDTGLQRDVAIKFLLPSEALTSAELLRLCVREARAIARMDHENIVRVFELDDKNDPPFMVMEYLRGRTLDEPMRQGRVPDDEILRVMVQVARGLAHAHALGVVHRDLKPSNVFLLEGGQVKLLDFGLARLNATAADAMRPTGDLTPRILTLPLAGTAAYMAPEQWLGAAPDTRTDMWSAFVVLFELLTGGLPYVPENMVRMADKVTSRDPTPPLRKWRPDLPGDFLDWFERCFSKERAQRCQTAEELERRLLDLADALASGVTSKPRADPQAAGFWTDAPAPGLSLHRASRRSGLPYWPRSLLLFLETPGARWETVAERTLRVAHIDLDTALYAIEPDADGATPLVGQAAALQELLQGELKRYRNVLVAAHDLGAQVVKRMFVDGAAGTAAQEQRFDPKSYLYRVRQLVHVDDVVPGASQRRPGTPAGAAADRVDREFRRFCQEMAETHVPYPALQRVSVSRGADGALDLAAVASRLAPLLIAPELVIARESIAQSFALDCASKIQLLAESEAGDRAQAAATVAAAKAGTQGHVFRTLFDLAQQSHRQPPCVVVTGDVGVGKSAVLRHLTRRINADYLEAPRGSGPLCVFVPMSLVSFDGELSSGTKREKGAQTFDRLLDWWCAWFEGQTYRDAAPRFWLRARLRAEPAVIVLDGVDDFLANNPAYGPDDVRQMLHHVRTSFADNKGLVIVVGVRSTEPALLSLASEPGHVYEILRPADA